MANEKLNLENDDKLELNEFVSEDEEYIPPTPEYFNLSEFKFNNGQTLKNVKVEYMTLGTPKYDDNGVISNGVIYFHGSGSDYSSVDRKDETFGPGLIFDTDKFFIISLSALGHPGSASPSSTGLAADFPEYDVEDMVNFQYQFIQEKFGITHLKGLIGNSMGGFEVLTWACMYPDSIDFAVSMVSSHKVGGHNYALSYVMNTILESDPDYNDGFYKTPISQSLKRSLRLASHAMYTYGFSREFYRFDVNNQELAEGMEEFAMELVNSDVNDVIYMNKSSMDYDLTDYLDKITAKVLIITINQDQYFPPNLDAIPLSKMIKDNELIIYDSNWGHVGTFELGKVEDKVRNFLKEFED